jgi:hypothetical protein
MKPDVCDCSLCCDRRRNVLVLVLMRIGPPRVKGSSKKLSCESTALHECYTSATCVRHIIQLSQGIASRPSLCEDHEPQDLSEQIYVYFYDPNLYLLCFFFF